MHALRCSLFSIARVINASHGSHEIFERQSHYKLVWRPFVSRSLKRRNEIHVRFSFCQSVADGETDGTGRVMHEGFGSFKTCQAQDSILQQLIEDLTSKHLRKHFRQACSTHRSQHTHLSTCIASTLSQSSQVFFEEWVK